MNNDFETSEQALLSNKSECQYRQTYHMTPPHGWMNDPNGFIFCNGEYHLFYQYYPFEPKWGLMHWGHCTSFDLVHWKHLPIALTPDHPYDLNGCFSGSSIVHNGQLFVFYTGNALDGRQTQCLAISSDFIHFKKYENNPIISQAPNISKPNHFRDPYVFKHLDQFYMTIGSSHSQHPQGQVFLYTSDNLVDWNYLSTITTEKGSMGYMWECPSIFPMNGHDILMLSTEGKHIEQRFHGNHNSGYFVGDLDFQTGKYSHGHFYPLDEGFDFYAPQTALDANDQRMMVAWMNIWDTPMPVTHCKWAGSMTLPRILTLENGALKSRPITALENYKSIAFHAKSIRSEQLEPLHGRVCELALQVEKVNTNSLAILLFGSADQQEYTALTWQPQQKQLSLDRNHSGGGAIGIKSITLATPMELLDLRIFLDQSSVEVFVNDGTLVLSTRVFPKKTSDQITLVGDALLKEINLWNII